MIWSHNGWNLIISFQVSVFQLVLVSTEFNWFHPTGKCMSKLSIQPMHFWWGLPLKWINAIKMFSAAFTHVSCLFAAVVPPIASAVGAVCLQTKSTSNFIPIKWHCSRKQWRWHSNIWQVQNLHLKMMHCIKLWSHRNVQLLQHFFVRWILRKKSFTHSLSLLLA